MTGKKDVWEGAATGQWGGIKSQARQIKLLATISWVETYHRDIKLIVINNKLPKKSVLGIIQNPNFLVFVPNRVFSVVAIALNDCSLVLNPRLLTLLVCEQITAEHVT